MSFVVLTAEWFHETNTFNRNLTEYHSFMDRFGFFGADAIRERGDANTELAGFLDVARRHGWETIHVLSASAEPAGYVTRDAFDRLGGAIVKAAMENKDKLSGILLGLHGAMVTEFNEDGEGELLRRLREVVGPTMPIAITLDLHANVTPLMCELANIICSYKTYPHVDMRERGNQAGEILHRAMKGEIRPRTLRAHRPMLDEANGGRTDIGPMVSRVAEAVAYEKETGVYAVSINAGFGNADIADVGPTVLVTYDGDEAQHRAFAESIMDDIWQKRFDVLNNYMPVEEAAAIAKAYTRTKGPIIIADYADNPGGGGYGDSTNLLAALLAAGIEDAAFGPMVDPEVAQQLRAHRVGDKVSLQLGGKTDPRFGGGPLHVTAELKLVSDGAYTGDGPMVGGLRLSFGPSAVIQVDGIEILVTTEPAQMLDLQQFRAFGIDPAAKTVVGLKSMQHFRAAFEPIAGQVIVCDSGALCTTYLDRLPYRNVSRPIYPLDRQMAR
ncbi:microcystin degradation protein MlrC [Dongia mobilis]|uniref:Microcystinase C n=1 Tax=Dongia mobilis TaxID=578943 RepID=A0A4V3DEU2_9PROT|nr:M81 family metallopeptidase [Dongia mobilis]TDQ83000.1 microcystin degradation protein MlrC [Dongia mobilis]